MADNKNFATIYINPALIHTTKKDGSPIMSKKGEALASISVPPVEKDGEWGSFVVKADAIKEAKSQTEDGKNYKFVTKPVDYVFTVSYGKEDNRTEEKITAEDMAKKFNHKKKEKEQETREIEQEEPELG